MTVSDRYMAILARISPNTPLELDPTVFPNAGPPASAPETKPAPFAPSAQLWRRDVVGPSYIGIRVTHPIPRPQTLAAQVAAAAIERQIVPIFLSWNGTCDMQRFGFRVEYICGATERDCADLEHQLARMWNLAIIVDAGHVSQMG